MNKLCINLPPLSPDYSGVCSALYELGGMSIIHDASGCTGNYTGYDEPRWYGNQKLVFCSGLREIDAVLGDDKKFIRKVKQAEEDLKPEFIAILGSPVPMVIGSDLIGIAKEIESEMAIPTMGFNTTGLEYYDIGIQMAYREIARTFLTEKMNTVSKSINLLGATPLDFYINGNIKDIIRFFIEEGYNINSCWSMNSNLKQIKLATRAELNVVLAISGLELARYLKKEFDIPYIVGLPIGQSGETRVLNLLRGLNDNEKIQRKTGNEKILIIGEQVFSNSLRYMLNEEYDKNDIDVATFFIMDQELSQGEDFRIDSEFHLTKLLKDEKYNTIIGDPLIKALLPQSNSINYISIPHVAVSSKIHWNESIEFIGKKVYQILEKRGLCYEKI